VEFLRLMGVKPQFVGSSQRHTSLYLSRAQNKPLDIPKEYVSRLAVRRQWRTSASFVTLETVTIPAVQQMINTIAYHCEIVAAELAGVGTGLPGLTGNSAPPALCCADG